MALRLLGEQQIAQQLFSEMKQWAQEMAKTSIEADFFAVSQPDLLSLYGDLQPVSYTHLDVYKRQPLNKGFCSPMPKLRRMSAASWSRALMR